MANYTLAHFSASASRIDMEDIVKAHGGFEIKSYDIARLTVTANEQTIESFQKKHPHWIINKIAPAP